MGIIFHTVRNNVSSDYHDIMAYMTHDEFIMAIRNEYLKARNFIYIPKHNSEVLRRGTSRTISSISEDIFAAYCAELATDIHNLEIIADPQISFSGTGLRNINDKKSLLIRPDIVICRNNIVECMFDLKMDLGFKRGLFLNGIKEKNDQVNLIKGYTALINSKSYFISDEIRLVYILLSEKNNGRASHLSNMKNAEQFENINLFLLSNGDHLNAYHSNPVFNVNEVDFSNLDKILSLYLT